jgi:hypothetical protein
MGPQAALMDADNTVNAAGKRVGGLLSVEWTTRGTTTTDNSGAAAWRGFYGVYTVEVALPDGQTFTREVSLTAAGKSAAVHLPPGA